jgi:hypothetical protein
MVSDPSPINPTAETPSDPTGKPPCPEKPDETGRPGAPQPRVESSEGSRTGGGL